MAYGPAYGVITRDAFHVHRDVDLQLRGLRGRRAVAAYRMSLSPPIE